MLTSTESIHLAISLSCLSGHVCFLAGSPVNSERVPSAKSDIFQVSRQPCHKSFSHQQETRPMGACGSLAPIPKRPPNASNPSQRAHFHTRRKKPNNMRTRPPIASQKKPELRCFMSIHINARQYHHKKHHICGIGK